MYVLSIVVCPFVLFLLAIVLSVLLRYTVSDCPFGIFKLFLLLLNYLACELPSFDVRHRPFVVNFICIVFLFLPLVKTKISNLVHTTLFSNDLHRIRRS
jgi:hypothetical protein